MDAIVFENCDGIRLRGTLPFSVKQSLQATAENYREELRIYSQGASDDVCQLLALLEELFRSQVIARVTITGMSRIDMYLECMAPDGSWLPKQHRLFNLRSAWNWTAPDIPLTIAKAPEPRPLRHDQQKRLRLRRSARGTRTDWISVVLDFISDLLDSWWW